MARVRRRSSCSSVWEEGKERRSTRATLRNQTLFGMAGLYEERLDSNGNAYRTFTVVTSPLGGQASPDWGGMPLVLGETEWDEWLDPSNRDKTLWGNRLRPDREAEWELSLEAERPVPIFAD